MRYSFAAKINPVVTIRLPFVLTKTNLQVKSAVKIHELRKLSIWRGNVYYLFQDGRSKIGPNDLIATVYVAIIQCFRLQGKHFLAC